MSDTLSLFLLVEMGAVFGAFYLSERKGKFQGRTVKPSPQLRISAIVVGLMGIGLEFLMEWNLMGTLVLMPWVIILLGYGFFGLFGKGSHRPSDGPQE